jgi:hypothetical protein
MAKAIVRFSSLGHGGTGYPVQLSFEYVVVPDYQDVATLSTTAGGVSLNDPPLDDGPDVIMRLVIDQIKSYVFGTTSVVMKDSDFIYQPFVAMK